MTYSAFFNNQSLSTKETNYNLDKPTHKSIINNTHTSINSRIKRIIDIVGALIGLSLTALIFMPIAIAIKIDNPGAIFYSQIRCGHRGKQFRIWKF